MKVLCIDDKQTESGLIQFGNVYTVTGEDDNNFIFPVYILSEIPNTPYCKHRFIPLSEIDEKEMNRHYQIFCSNKN